VPRFDRQLRSRIDDEAPETTKAASALGAGGAPLGREAHAQGARAIRAYT
jgi:hypothetical protein